MDCKIIDKQESTYISAHGLSRIEITLSRSNLRALLHKLDVEGSKRTIEKKFGKVTVSITSEEDAPHYGTRRRGQMSKETEAFLAGRSRRYTYPGDGSELRKKKGSNQKPRRSNRGGGPVPLLLIQGFLRAIK